MFVDRLQTSQGFCYSHLLIQPKQVLIRQFHQQKFPRVMIQKCNHHLLLKVIAEIGGVLEKRWQWHSICHGDSTDLRNKELYFLVWSPSRAQTCV